MWIFGLFEGGNLIVVWGVEGSVLCNVGGEVFGYFCDGIISDFLLRVFNLCKVCG